MTNLLVFVAGYLWGGTPTADWLAGRRGLDLRASGSGNPGANNALRLGGRGLGAAILAVELAKGSSAAALGWMAAGDPGMVFAGLGAIGGNILNPYRRLRGGQGLGIATGALLAAFPVAAMLAIGVAAIVVVATRSSSVAALAASTALVVAAVWAPAGPWGVASGRWAAVLAVGSAGMVVPRQLARLRRSCPPALRARG